MDLRIVVLIFLCTHQIVSDVSDCHMTESSDNVKYECPDSNNPKYTITYWIHGITKIDVFYNVEDGPISFRSKNYNVSRYFLSADIVGKMPSRYYDEFAKDLIGMNSTYTFMLVKYMFSENNVLRSNTPSLQEVILSLHDIEISDLEPEISDNLKSLTQLNIIKLRLSTLPEDLFANNEELKHTTITNNERNITELTSGLLKNLRHPQKISLTNLNLTNIPADTFSYWTKITSIDLSYNHLQNLPEVLFHGLVKLDILSLEFNELEIIPGRLFRDLRRLSALNLCGNQIKTIKK